MVSKYVHKHISNLFYNYPTSKIEFQPNFKFKISIISKNKELVDITVEENDSVTLKVPPFIDYSVKIENTYPNPEICYTLESFKTNGRTVKIVEGHQLFCFEHYLVEGYSKKCTFISVNDTVIELTFKQWNVVTNNGIMTLVDTMNMFKIKVKLDTLNS